MGPGFLARVLGGFVRRGVVLPNHGGALQARLDFESEWDDDDDTIVDIGDYADDEDFGDIEDEEILESAEYSEDDDS